MPRLKALLAAVLMLTSGAALASPVIYDFQGTLTWQTGIYGTQPTPEMPGIICVIAGACGPNELTGPLPIATESAPFSLTFAGDSSQSFFGGAGQLGEWTFTPGTDSLRLLGDNAGGVQFWGVVICDPSSPPRPANLYCTEGGRTSDAQDYFTVPSTGGKFSGVILAGAVDSGIGPTFYSTFDVGLNGVLSVPEPGTLAPFAFGLAALGLLLYRRRGSDLPMSRS